MNEVVLDTNIFLRYLIQDLPDQFEKAKEIFWEIEKGEKIGLISILVINELIWILENYYQLKRASYIPKIINIFSLNNIEIIEVKKSVIEKILEKMKKRKVDFTDFYLMQITTPEKLISFDKDFQKIQKES